MIKSENDVLYVKTFGGFSMVWHGKEIGTGMKTRESQFAYLMQVLLHNRENGISRDKLEEILFEGRDINNPYHAMQTIIYNAKKKLRNAGLPDINYIIQKKGVFYWTDKIAVVEDAAEFERLFQEAEAAADPDEKLNLYLDACHTYTGEFLPTQAGVLWVAQESRRYRSKFFDCVEKAVVLLREKEDYFRMEELGIYAAKLNPLSNWEVITMEALVSIGRYEEAAKLYDDTVDFYFQEQGLRPSGKLMELLNQLGMHMEHSYAIFDNIQSELAEEENEPGGYLCAYPVFQGIYRMMKRMMERGGQSIYLMLCTIVDSKGNPMKKSGLLDELSERLEAAIRPSVRHGDVISRYGKGQYLILLVNTTRENCKIVQKRINYKFIVGRQRTGIRYYVNCVFCPTDKEEITCQEGKG